jgi:RNA polymerase sigma factor (sigma-70 family)
MTALEFNHQLISLEDKLFGFALRLTMNIDDAKDLLQETLLKAYTYRNQFVEYTNMRAWAYTIMKNTFINNYRRNVLHRTTLDSSDDLFFLSQSKEIANTTPDSIYSALQLTKLIDSLEKEFRIPFKMHLEGYKYKEISEELKLNIGTVKSRIYFARQKLMKVISQLN